MSGHHVDRRVASLVSGVDPEIRRELQEAVRTLRAAHNPKSVLNGMTRTCLFLTRRLYGFLGQKPPSDNLFDHVEDLKKKGILPAELASNLHNIRSWSNKADHGAESVELLQEDAENALSSFLRVLTWFHCECPCNPARLPSIYKASWHRRDLIRAAWWIGGALVVAALVAAFLEIASVRRIRNRVAAPPEAALRLPEHPGILIAPLQIDSDRPVDRRLWTSADHVIAASLNDLDPSAMAFRVEDPLLVAEHIARRRIPPGHAIGSTLELLAGLRSDIAFHGSIRRVAGQVEITGQLLQADGQRVAVLTGRGADVFEASASLARNACVLLNAVCNGREGQPGPEPIDQAWRNLVSDPWSETRYQQFATAAGNTTTAEIRLFAETLRQQGSVAADCGPVASDLERKAPDRWGALAPAICLFRQKQLAASLVAAERAFRNPALRHLAAVFQTKASVGAVRTKEERIALVERRVDHVPGDVDGWWLLANLYAAEGRLDDARLASQVADSLGSPDDIGFNAAANAFHTLLQLMGPALDEETVSQQMERPGVIEEWMRTLDAATAIVAWDVSHRACRKATLLQLRGRTRDAQTVLSDAWEQLLSDHPGEKGPLYNVGTALFYLLLDDGLQAEAERVLATFERRIEKSARDMHTAVGLMKLALRAHRGSLPASRIPPAARALLDQAGADAGRTGMEGALCLVLSHTGPLEEARVLALQADPENTMMAGCRFRAGEALFRQGRFQEAIEKFTQARRDILFRADWYAEFYLPALVLEARARAELGQKEESGTLLRAVVRQYRNADDRLLPRVQEARDLLDRLGSSNESGLQLR